jgi:hypothetical protein
MTLLQTIERHLRVSGQTHTHFGRTVARDPHLVGDIRRGREVGQRLAHRINHYLEICRVK